MASHKQTVLVLFFLFFNHGLFSQNTVIKGYIVSEDSTPIQYATIHDDSRQSGTFSDSLGRFSIGLPGNVKELHVSAIGYKNNTVTIDPKGNLSDVYIVLINDTLMLREVVISSKTFKSKPLELAPRKKTVGDIIFCAHANANREVGLYVPNPDRIRGEINDVQFYLKKESVESKRFIRLRIYSVDEALLPENDLLRNNILLQVKTSKNYQRIKVDLKQYHIQMPLNGIVVVVELVQDTQGLHPNNLTDQNTWGDNCSSFAILQVDDKTGSFVNWERLNKANWYKIDSTNLLRQHGFKVTNVVPYAKVTIKEYAD